MKTDFNFIAGLFNNAEQTAENINNLPAKAYKVRVNGNIAIIESLWVSKLGGMYTTKDVRTVYPTMEQLNRLQRFGFESFVYQDLLPKRPEQVYKLFFVNAAEDGYKPVKMQSSKVEY